ncbi:MAG: hypothetical protein NTW61_01125 [Candidatus Melainabacteria bacterium]|nr:hypothetical protein [Candidatus Melainabacteria bacterium]
MLKQWIYQTAPFFRYDFLINPKKLSRGFSLIEVGFLVMVITIVILPTVAAINANSHSGAPSINEVLERQQSIEQGMRSLMQRAINGKIIISDIDNPTTQFEEIDEGMIDPLQLFNLGSFYPPIATTTTPAEYHSPLLFFKVPIGVQDDTTKPLFKFKWQLKDVSSEDSTNPTISGTPEGLRKIDLLLQAYPPDATDADISSSAVTPLATLHGTTFYSINGTTSVSSNGVGVMIDIDLNKSGCKTRRLVGPNIFNKRWHYNPDGSQQSDCGENTSIEPTEGIKDWYDEEYAKKDELNSPYAYLTDVGLGIQTMENPYPTDPSGIQVPLGDTDSNIFSVFLGRLPNRLKSKGGGTTHYDDIKYLPPYSYAFSATNRAIEALKGGSYTQGVIIHIITTNLDSANEQSGLTTHPYKVSLSTEPRIFLDPNNPDSTTDDLLKLAKNNKNTQNASGEQLSIKHYVILHKGIARTTADYFTAMANETGGGVYSLDGDNARLQGILSTIFKSIGSSPKKKRSKTYRHSMD